MPKRMLYAGTILNGFTILEDLPSENGKAKVKAICPICNNEFIGLPKTIKNGDCKSCGCLKKKIAKENLQKALQHSTRIYYKGQTINNFYILEDLPTEKEVSMVKAICPYCNIPFSVRVKDIKSGNTKSCGCIKSHGEFIISKILKENNLTFSKEYSFNDLKYKKLLRFDFAIFKNNQLQYLIEYDGIQHFKEIDTSWSNSDNLKLIQCRDELKNSYCKNNNIPLIRIPYTHLKDLCLEDLQLETTTFLVS